MREFLIKTFDKEEYAQSFIQNGEMLFRHIRYFNQIEDNQVRGDSEEGLAKENATLHLNQNVKTIHLGNSRFAVDWERFKKEHPEIKFKDENVEFRLTYYADVQLYCMTYVASNTENLEEIFSNAKSFGQYSAVITNWQDFLAKIKNIPTARCGLVEYSDNEERTLFKKRLAYKNQNEFRIFVEGSEDSRLLTVGHLQGFVCNAKSLGALKAQLME